MGEDDKEVLVARMCTEGELGVAAARLQPAVVRREFRVLPVDPHPVVLVERGDGSVGDLGEQHATQVIALQRVALDRAHRSARRIEQHQRGQIHTLVGVQVHEAVVRIEADRPALLGDVAAVDTRERVLIDAQDLGVASVRGAQREAQPPLVVERPPGDALGVLADERALAGRNAHPVEVVPGLVAVVEPHEHDVRLVPRQLIDLGARSFRVGDVAGRWHLPAARWRVGRVDRVDVEVLIPVVVLHVQQVPAIAAPEVAGNRPVSLGAHRLRGGERLGGLLDPDVAHSLVGLDEREIAAVGRDLRVGDLHLAEERLAVDEGRQGSAAAAAQREHQQRVSERSHGFPRWHAWPAAPARVYTPAAPARSRSTAR